jgi:hypothetical protein
MATREELQKQLSDLDAKDKQLQDLKSKVDNSMAFNKSKAYNGTKIAISAIVIFLALIGVLGSMKWGIFSNFDMNSFTSFLGSYQGIFITLTASIGIGGIAKNVLKGKANGNGNGNGEEAVADETTEEETAASSTTSASVQAKGEDLVKRGGV